MTSVGAVTRLHPIAWLRRNPRAADVTAIAVTFHVLALGPAEDQRDPSWWTVVFVIASVFPIAWRRSFPIQTGLFVAVAQIVTALLDIDGTGFLGVLIALYSIGAHSAGQRRTNALWAIGAGILLLFIAGLTVGELQIGDFISSTVVLVTAFVLGDNLRRRREKADGLAERAERAEREQALIAQQQVNAERTRIARELHDVVAHSVSVMVIQAAAARRNLTDAPDVARTALANIEDTGRQTMNELRGILGVLRSETDAGSTLAPQPSMTDLDALVRTSEDLPIRLRIDGSLEDLAPSVTLSGYRVVQEAITNVRRHAGPVSEVTIDVERGRDRLTINIADDGRGAAADDIGPGYGMVGMRERVAAVGGSVAAGPRSGGGWRVNMVLPAAVVPAAVVPSPAPAPTSPPNRPIDAELISADTDTADAAS
jgi:signal transduction histidine kinase